jgi:septum formation protein
MWRNPGRKILLASQSPRRREILGKMGFSFESVKPDVGDEGSFLDVNDVECSLKRLAMAKARSVAVQNPGALILGADTIVYCEGAILGKPRNGEEAAAMLRLLKGKSHLVYTGIALMGEEDRFSESDVETTKVFFRDIDEGEIVGYIDAMDYRDKAGAYAIQGSAMIFISKIEGCFYNVVGLPIQKTISLFKAFLRRKETAHV